MPKKHSTPTTKTQPKQPNRRPRSYTPLADALNQPLTFVDTELAEGIERHSLIGLLRAAIGPHRRSDGEPLPNLLFALLVWPPFKSTPPPAFSSDLSPSPPARH